MGPANKQAQEHQWRFGIGSGPAIHRSASPPGSSTTTCGVTSPSHAPSAGNAKASRGTTFSTTSRSRLTNTAISTSRLYRENKLPFFAPTGVAIPITVSAFPDELYQARRSWVEARAYPKLIHYNKLDKGAATLRPG
jgi:hypothetical protein